jgi:hypothetical protein
MNYYCTEYLLKQTKINLDILFFTFKLKNEFMQLLFFRNCLSWAQKILMLLCRVVVKIVWAKLK